LALGVKVCIGLIEHDEKRTAIKRSGKTYPLALAGRQQGAPLANLRRIPVGQRDNKIMRAGHRGRLEYRLLADTVLEAANVVGDAAIKKGDLLRQVSDVPPKPIALPLVETRPVQSYLAVGGLPQSDDGLGERGFSRAACADQSKPTPSTQGERNIPGNNAIGATRHDDDVLHPELVGGPGP